MFPLQAQTITHEEIVARKDSTIAAIQSFAQDVINDPTAALHGLLERSVEFGLKLLAAILLYIVGIWLIRRIKKRAVKLLTKKGTDQAIISFANSFIGIALTVLLIVVTVGTLGINTSSIAALLAAGGMAIGIALSGTVQNMAGGLMITVFKPFKHGDLIKAQGTLGTVSEITIVATTLKTSDSRSVIIPNGILFNGTIDNYTRIGLRRIDWTLSLEYGTNADDAIRIISEMVKSDVRVLNAATAGAADVFVALDSLGDNAINFIVKAWVKEPDYWPVFYEMNKRFYTELQQQGFSFPFPQLDVHLTK